MTPLTRLSSVKAINIIILTIISFLRPSVPDLQSIGSDTEQTEGQPTAISQSPYGAGITNITYSSVLSLAVVFSSRSFSSSVSQSHRHSISHSSLSDLIHLSTTVSLLMSYRVSLTFFLFYRPILVQQTKPTAVLCLTARFIYVRMIYFSERHLEFNGKCCTHHIGVSTTCR